MTKAYTINDPDGSFRVFNLDGNPAFDSRLSTQLIHMKGTVVVAQPVSIEALTWVPFGKTFDRIPYMRSAARLFEGPAALDESKNFYPPKLGWAQNVFGGLQYFNGNYTAAQNTGAYFGNQWQGWGRLRFVFTAFENPVG